MSALAKAQPSIARRPMSAPDPASPDGPDEQVWSRKRPSRCPHIDGVAIDELVASLWLAIVRFSEQSLVSRYHDLRQAFARRYARVRLAWSYKTNYLEAICRVFHREGPGRVVSADGVRQGAAAHRRARRSHPLQRTVQAGCGDRDNSPRWLTDSPRQL